MRGPKPSRALTKMQMRCPVVLPFSTQAQLLCQALRNNFSCLVCRVYIVVSVLLSGHTCAILSADAATTTLATMPALMNRFQDLNQKVLAFPLRRSECEYEGSHSKPANHLSASAFTYPTNHSRRRIHV